MSIWRLHLPQTVAWGMVGNDRASEFVIVPFRSFIGHTDANFNIAILDGHKEFVAHEKFQQLLHKK